MNNYNNKIKFLNKLLINHNKHLLQKKKNIYPKINNNKSNNKYKTVIKSRNKNKY